LGFVEANLFFGLNDNDINKNIRKIVKSIWKYQLLVPAM
jgi:hypothetical protein